MRILVLDDAGPDLTAIETALRLGRIEVMAPQGSLVPAAPDEGVYVFAGWRLDPATRDLFGPGRGRANLTSSEFELLVAFLRRPGQTISRADLTRALRGRAWDYFDRSIDTLVARLRKKIDAPGQPSLIRSVRSVGYVFCAQVARDVPPIPDSARLASDWRSPRIPKSP